jgi:hypothetical protein
MFGAFPLSLADRTLRALALANCCALKRSRRSELCIGRKDVGFGSIATEMSLGAMSGLPPTATELRTLMEVRFVPTHDMARRPGVAENSHVVRLEDQRETLRNIVGVDYVERCSRDGQVANNAINLAVCEFYRSRHQHTFARDCAAFHEPMIRRKINEMCNAPPQRHHDSKVS